MSLVVSGFIDFQGSNPTIHFFHMVLVVVLEFVQFALNPVDTIDQQAKITVEISIVPVHGMRLITIIFGSLFLIVACESPDVIDDRLCQKYGAKPGSEAYVKCRATIHAGRIS